MKSVHVAVSLRSGTRPAPHGAGGLKFQATLFASAFTRPAPHGAGGLKSREIDEASKHEKVPPRTERVG